MEQWQRGGIDRLEAAGYLQVFRGLVKSHTAPVWWFRESGPAEESILHNGTISFVDTGSGILAVTALHVYEEYVRECREFKDVTCQVGSVRVALEDYLRGSDPNVDLAVFALPDVLIAGSGAIAHGPSKWPPDRLLEGDLVVCGGYPGRLRKPGAREVEFAFVSFIGRISQASDDHVAVYLNVPNSHWPQGEALGEAPDLGGASGGPVYRITTEPIEKLEIAGFIYEYGQSYELLFARHADLVFADGRV